MALYKEGCGHPIGWTMRTPFNGIGYSYCLGCLVEKVGLDNLEKYDNPYIKLNKTKRVVFDNKTTKTAKKE